VTAGRTFHLARWATQAHAVEVWIEKDALVGLLEDICFELDVPYFSCRGYVSQSAMYEAAQRIINRYETFGIKTTILHLGDHDPSGIDMTRDIQERLTLFTDDDPDVYVKRIALSMAQIQLMNPPPNPAKLTDARAKKYIKEYGDLSWELDAMEPRKLVQLIRDEVELFIDDDKWGEVEKQEKEDRSAIMKVTSTLRNY
jgi:hypothetical protein